MTWRHGALRHRYLNQSCMLNFERALQPHRSGQGWILHSLREAVMSAAPQRSPMHLFAYATPLLKEEWNAGVLALPLYRNDPEFFHRSCAGAAFAAHDYPYGQFGLAVCGKDS
jgi:hypothetical protein